jgi:hypothetical protein
MLSQRTVAKLETLLVKLCTEPFYSVPAMLDGGKIYKYLYEEGVSSELLNYLGHEYNYDPLTFVRAIHEGHPIRQFAQIYLRNPYLANEQAVEYADIILLIVGSLTWTKFKELDPYNRSMLQREMTDFLSSAKADGFSFTNETFHDSNGEAVAASRLWDLSSPKPSATTRATAAPAPAPMPVQVPVPQQPQHPISTPPTVRTSLAAKLERHKGKRGSFWTILALVIAILSVVATIATPELRRFVGLDKPKLDITSPAQSSATNPPQQPNQSASKSQSSAKDKPQGETPSTPKRNTQ